MSASVTHCSTKSRYLRAPQAGEKSYRVIHGAVAPPRPSRRKYKLTSSMLASLRIAEFEGKLLHDIQTRHINISSYIPYTCSEKKQLLQTIQIHLTSKIFIFETHYRRKLFILYRLYILYILYEVDMFCTEMCIYNY